MEFKDWSLPEIALELAAPSIQPDEDLMGIDRTALDKVEDIMDNITLTNNGATAFKSSLSDCLDFFYQIQETTDASLTEGHLEAAWKEDPNVTLRLIFQLRDIRNGKGIRNPFLFCLDWLKRHHFQTLLYSLQFVAEVGCWKDLLNLLVVDVMGTEAFESRSKIEQSKGCVKRQHLVDGKWEKLNKYKAKVIFEESKIDRSATAAAARTAFLKDDFYRQLHIQVASLFAKTLKEDLEKMKQNKGVSLAAKWAPTGGNHHDKFTLIVSTISQLLFPRNEIGKKHQSYEAYVSAARNLYRKIYISPLRNHSKVIERIMSDRRWEDIPYNRVPSKCMNSQKMTFLKRDEERFKKYLEEVKSGKKKINAAAMNPHEWVAQVMKDSESMDETLLKTIQLQWDAYVQKLKETGSLSNCMAMVDVSGSMNGLPMQVSIALGLVVAKLADEPYKDILLTFSSTPAIFQVPDGPLDVQVKATLGMDWGGSTNVEAAFDLILQRAVESELPREAMIKRLFIFSDMQFNDASETGDTCFHNVKTKYNAAGYDLPQVVFWNLYVNNYGKGMSAPVVKHENNAALVSGFSGQLLKLFVNDNLEEFDPISILMAAIESYTYLKVVD